MYREALGLILQGLWYTAYISALTLLIGTILGAGLCALRLSSRKWHNQAVKYYIMIFRGFPPLVVLMLMFYVVLTGWNPVAIAIVAFSLVYSTHATDVFYAGYRSVSPTQSTAAMSLGLSRYQAFRYIVLPQMLNNCAPVLKDHVGGHIKATSIVGYIAVIDLTKAVDLVKEDSWAPVIPILLVGFFYFLFTYVSGKAIDSILKKL